MKIFYRLFLIILIFVSCSEKQVQETEKVSETNHPNLILTNKSVAEIKLQLGTIPVFDETLKLAKEEVDVEIEKGIDVPIPKIMQRCKKLAFYSSC